MKGALVILMALTGCADKVEQRTMILADVNTGCQYVGYVESGIDGGANLKALIGPDGKPLCRIGGEP